MGSRWAFAIQVRERGLWNRYEDKPEKSPDRRDLLRCSIWICLLFSAFLLDQKENYLSEEKRKWLETGGSREMFLSEQALPVNKHRLHPEATSTTCINSMTLSKFYLITVSLTAKQEQ